MRKLLAVALLALGACAPMELVEAPEVSLVGLAPVEVNLLEQRLAATLRVRNPNPEALTVDGVRFALEVNGKPFGKGMGGQTVTVPRFGTADVPAEIAVPTVNLLRQAVDAPQKERLAYSLSGTLYLAGTLRRSVGFEQKGEVDLGQ